MRKILNLGAFVVMLSVLLAGQAVKAQNSVTPLTLGTYYIPGLAESAERGVLIDLLNEIRKDAALNVQVLFASTKRIQEEFRDGDLLGYFPELDEYAPPGSCRSDPIGYKGIYAFWRKGSEQPKTLSDLKGKYVGIVEGYSYGREIMEDDQIMKEAVTKDEANIKKLMTGRIDYIIGDGRSTVTAIRNAGLEEEILWSPNEQITSLPFFFLFQNTEEGLTLCHKFTKAMRNIHKRDGGFKGL